MSNDTGQPESANDLLRRTEEELRQSNELFSRFMRHSPIHAYIKTVTPTESRVLHASDNFHQMIGVSAPDMVGKTMAELFPAELAAQMTADDWAVVSKGEVLTRDEDLDGRHYVSVKFPIVLGNKTMLAGYTIDITERRRAEEALKESRRLLVETQRIGSVGGWEFDIDTRAQTWTEEVYRIHEVDPAYKPTVDGGIGFYAPAYRPVIERAVQNAVERGESFDVELEIITARGNRRWVHVLGRTDLVRRRVVGFFQDITNRKRAEQEKAALEARLQQAQKMELVGHLAGGVAHEFNNMLGVILGHAELALAGADPAHPLCADLEGIRTAAMRSADLVRQLLAFAGRQIVTPRVLDLNQAVATTIGMLERLVRENIRLTWQPGADLWRVKIDPSQVAQILANLCVNARDAIDGVGTITIATANRVVDAASVGVAGATPGEYVQLTVTDDGCGMDHETLAHIFEPFFTTKGVGRGSGLGLASAQGAVKQNGGFIQAHSVHGEGTTFDIYLPRDIAERGQARAKALAEPTPLGRETILLVEDEPSLLALTAVILERLGYTVLTAGGPAEAVRLATEHAGRLDLLMTDVVMPEMNGQTLARRLLALHPHLKRLFVSGYAADVIGQDGEVDRGVRFLQKPFSVDVLAAKIRETLDRA